MRELPGDQQGDKWFEHRLGRVTGSRIKDLLTQPRSKADKEAGVESETRRKYRFFLTGERVTKMVLKNRPETPSMMWGQLMETKARSRFEEVTGKMLIPVGFVLHPTQDFSGASPDSLVVGGGIYEGKAPDSDTHLRWLDEGIVPEEHMPQCQWEMRCTEMTHGWFHSWDPRIPGAGQDFIAELEIDSEWVSKLEMEAAKIDSQIEAWLAVHGFPSTVWNTKGDEVIHSPRYTGEDIPDFGNLSGSEWDFLDKNLSGIP